MPKDYCGIDDVKSALGITGTQDDQFISAAISAASRNIDHHCGRQFYQGDAAEARVYIPDDLLEVQVDDFDQTQSGVILQTDPAGDRTWSTTLTSDQYQLIPLNGIQDGEAWPCTKIQLIKAAFFPLYGGAALSLRRFQALIKVTAVYGWPYVPNSVYLATIAEASSIFQGMKNPLGATAFNEAGIVRSKPELHPTAQKLLEKYCERLVYVQ